MDTDSKNIADKYQKDKQGFKSRLGLCYPLAGRFVFKNKDWNLVHGQIFNRFTKDPPFVHHAWCEKGDKVFDPVADKEFDKYFYYQLFNAKPLQIYNCEQTMIAMLRNKHWGPWVGVAPKKRFKNALPLD